MSFYISIKAFSNSAHTTFSYVYLAELSCVTTPDFKKRHKQNATFVCRHMILGYILQKGKGQLIIAHLIVSTTKRNPQ